MPFINEVVNRNREQLIEPAIKSSNSVTRFSFDPEQVSVELKSRIIGQDAMQNAIADQLHLIKSDIANPMRPLGVCLFLGPTGVGKTETARILAKLILGDPDQLCRIDMNTLSQAHYSAAITGAPPGYVGSKEHHSLLNPDKIEGTYSRPGIVLFDEIEKANQEVLRSLLNILDSGVLSLPTGTKEISFRNALILMTSNLGAKELARHQNKMTSRWREKISKNWSKKTSSNVLQEALAQRFDLEFINRIDQTIYFDRLRVDQVQELIQIEMKKINHRLRKHSTSLVLEETAEQFLIESYQANFGARDLIRHMRTHIEPALARVLNTTPQTNRQYFAEYVNGAIRVFVCE